MMTDYHHKISTKLQANNGRLRKELLIYTYKKLKRIAKNVIGNMEAEDFVQQAILQVLNGDRPWNPEKCPELFMHLAGCIKSIISNESQRKEHVVIIASEDDTTPLDSITSTVSNPEEEYEKLEAASTARKRITDLHQYIEKYEKKILKFCWK